MARTFSIIPPAGMAVALFIAGCASLLSPEYQYDEAFPKKHALDRFYFPWSLTDKAISPFNVFAVDTAAGSGGVAAYRHDCRSAPTDPWDKDTVEICRQGKCTRTLVTPLNLDSRTQVSGNIRYHGVQGLRFRNGRLWVLQGFQGDPDLIPVEVDLAKGVLDHGKPDTGESPVPANTVSVHGEETRIYEGSVFDPAGNRYMASNSTDQSKGFTAAIGKVDAGGKPVWHLPVNMSVHHMIWHEGVLYAAGGSGGYSRESSNSGATLAKITSDGTLVWIRSYHQASLDKDEYLTSVRVDEDGTIAALGHSGPVGRRRYLYGVQVDTAGKALSERIFAESTGKLSFGALRILFLQNGDVYFKSVVQESSTSGFTAYGELHLR